MSTDDETEESTLTRAAKKVRPKETQVAEATTYIARLQTEEERTALRYESYAKRAKFDPEKLFTKHAKRTNIHHTNPDFVYRLCNDQDDLVFQRMEMGYEIDRENDYGDSIAGREHLNGSVPLRSVGGNMKAVIMKCPKHIYDARQRKKQLRLEKIDKLLHNGRARKFQDDPRFQYRGLESGLVDLESREAHII
jgi:hypothetical protein